MWDDVPLPVVDSYKYLGMHLSQDGSWDKHIKCRLDKASAAAKGFHNVLHNSSLAMESP